MSTSKTMFQKPIFWIGIVGLGVAAFAVTEPDVVKPASTKATTKPKSTKPKKQEDVYNREDLAASFNPVNVETKNTFVPLVARHSGIGSADGMANAIPADFVGGEGNWVYTGTAESDGVRVALVENRTTGDAVFLRSGERWKSAYVVRVSGESVILRGPSGTRTLGLVDETLKSSSSSVAQRDPGFSPARVDMPQSLRGGMGRNNFPNELSLSPDPTAAQGALPGLPGND